MLDEESQIRVRAKLEADAAAGISQGDDAEEGTSIAGSLEVTSSITANVWEVHVTVWAHNMIQNQGSAVVSQCLGQFLNPDGRQRTPYMC